MIAIHRDAEQASVTAAEWRENITSQDNFGAYVWISFLNISDTDPGNTQCDISTIRGHDYCTGRR